MTEIKRYEEPWCEETTRFVAMRQDPKGVWVRWEDLEPFLLRLAALEEKEKQQEEFATIMDKFCGLK
jgi:hypothetical protein